MTIARMAECDFCENVSKEMNEGVVRLTDNVNEVRFHMCDSCLNENLGQIPLKPRRGRAAQAEEQAAAAA